MQKIIQIISHRDELVALDAIGDIYTHRFFDRIIDNGKDRYKEETDWVKGVEWVKLDMDGKEEYKKSQELSF